MTFEEAEKYVNQVRWQYAKTYPTAPHEYTCLDWNQKLHAKMVDFAYFVKINGYTEIFGKCAFRCLNIGEYKYWTMDDPWDKTDLINRTFVDNDKRMEVIGFVQTPDFKFQQGMCLADILKQSEAVTQRKLAQLKQENDGIKDLFGGKY